MTFMRKARARSAIARPMPPRPTTPSVLRPTLRPSGSGPLEPLAAAHEAFGEHDLAGRRQHHADGEVGAFVDEDARRVGHGNVALTRGGEVDGVDTDAEDGDDFEPGQGFDQRAGGAAIGLGGDAANSALEFRAECSVRQRIDGVVMILEALRERAHGRRGKCAEGQNDGLHGALSPTLVI